MTPEQTLKKRLESIGFFDDIDEELLLFCKTIRKLLRNEYDTVIGLTGFPGVGKSQATTVISLLIDNNYSFEKNVCFIPTSNEIKKLYLGLPMYSILHIDEASRGMHKHQWHDKIQQTLNTLYDSVSKDNEICFYDKNEFNRMTIEDMYNFYGENPNNIKVFVIDDDFNVKLNPLKKILKRPIRNPKKRMFRIKTRFNKETVVTEDHSLFVFQNRGEKIIEKSPKYINKGDKLIIPKILPSIENIEEDNDKMQLFGAWLADGCYQNDIRYNIFNSIKLSGFEHERILKIISKKFPNEKNTGIKCYNGIDFIFNNRNLVKEMINKEFIGDSYNKRIPKWIFNTTKENKINFLKGFFTGDGSINFEGKCSASSVNKELLRDIQILLNMLGIPSHFSKAKNPNTYGKNKSIIPHYSYRIDIPTMFHNKYINFFEPCKKNYNFLNNFIPSKGYMKSKRSQKFIKNQTICASVIEIEEIKNYEGHVYDLSVDGIHRFVSNDILHKNTDREGHFLCSILLMPRFQNFTENFRNFRIKYWINIIDRGYGICYIKDEDKDGKDPWHLDTNYKLKLKKWGRKQIFERQINDVIEMEKKTKNYFFWFKIPEVPSSIWFEYQELKRQSRIKMNEREQEMEVESHQDKLSREKLERWAKIRDLKIKGHTNGEIAAEIDCSLETIRRSLRAMEDHERMKGEKKFQIKKEVNKEIPDDLNKID